jgi:SAM-dependent MidA family methyltransferase
MPENQQNELQQLIASRIHERGRITFADFMAACLYEPGLGYYTSPGRKVGAAGDFYTSSNVHAVFGRLIARELRQMAEVLGRPDLFEIVEMGAGGGQLARDILDALQELDPALYATLSYRLMELEPTLREAQAELLAPHRERLAWSDPADLAAGRLAFTGCLLSNELVDAFPVHLVEMTAEGLREVYVTLRDGELAEELDHLSTPELANYLARLGVALLPGQRTEISLAAPVWLAGVATALARGFVLTIDYGYLAPERFGPMRMGGTLLCYHQHTVAENPFLRPGQQDITSHVDFSTLIARGEELGLATVWFGEQYRFLLGTGIMEELLALEQRPVPETQRLKDRLALKKLMLPEGGMGDTFKVLVQAKGVAEPQLLCLREWGASF